MKMIVPYLLFFFLGQCCLAQQYIQPDGMTICDRFLAPSGFDRVEAPQNSYANYLRNLPVKAHGQKVLTFDGRVKSSRGIYLAVVNIPIGRKNLHQCADAVMRLRAEFLWEEGRFSEIHFDFTNGMNVEYSKWMKGERIRVDGNHSTWYATGKASNSYDDFWSYLEQVFMYAGTASLEKQLKEVDWENMSIGDVLIQGGYPGHAVLVVDMVINSETDEKRYLLGQSYMPAQEFQILVNPESPNSPWYNLSGGDKIITPEWTFNRQDLMRF